MNIKNTIKSSIMSGLVAITLNASGNPNAPNVVVSTPKVSVKNLDNPGSTTFMVGDYAEISTYTTAKDPNPEGKLRSGFERWTLSLGETYFGEPVRNASLPSTIDDKTTIQIKKGDTKNIELEYTVANLQKNSAGAIKESATYNTGIQVKVVEPTTVYKKGFGDLRENKNFYLDTLPKIKTTDSGYLNDRSMLSGLIDRLTDGKNDNYEIIGRKYDFKTNTYTWVVAKDGVTPLPNNSWDFKPSRKELYTLYNATKQ